MLAQAQLGLFSCSLIQARQRSLHIRAKCPGHSVFKRFTRIDDRTHPTEAGIRSRGMAKLQEVLKDPPDFAAHRIAFALAQILDLLGDVLAVEAVVAGGHRAQHLGLVLRPGIEIILITWSVGHNSVPRNSALGVDGGKAGWRQSLSIRRSRWPRPTRSPPTDR